MKKILAIFLLFYSCQVFAVNWPEDKPRNWYYYELLRDEQKEQRILKAKLAKQINESGSSKNITAIVETRPTASKVGGSMLKRIYSPQAIVGTAAVTGLLAAIGWVMEDGVYVKQKKPEPEPNCGSNGENCTDYLQIWYFPNEMSLGTFATAKSAAEYYFKNSKAYNPPLQEVNNVSCTLNVGYATCTAQGKNSGGNNLNLDIDVTQKSNPNYEGEEPLQKVSLTATTLGTIMLGSGYSDPAGDTEAEQIINDDEWTSVPEAYTPDDSGIGNELSDELQDKADNAPPTSDGKPSTLTDPKYQNELKDNDKANDRSWQSGDGTEGSTDSTQTTDPETGTTSNTGTFKLPAFCDWAMTMCQWYDDWTSSDKVQKDHMTKTEEHQTEEKSFWEDVKDWFDWTKEPVDEEPETEEEEPDTQGIFDRTFDTAFSLSKECPPDIPFSLETEFFSGSWNISMNWLCIIFTFLGYPLVFLSHCVGLWILYEAVVQREIKW